MGAATGDLKPGHLVRRFFDVLGSRPLTPAEQLEAASWLRPPERGLFWQQSATDQRHALTAARRAATARPDRPDLIRAALLHDVGKRHARLAILGRVLAAIVQLLHAPPPSRRLRVYLEHGAIGARELEAAGAEPIVVEFARSHHSGRPQGVSSEDWQVLVLSDDV